LIGGLEHLKIETICGLDKGVVSFHKSGQFPDEFVKPKVHKFTMYPPGRTSNRRHKGDRVRGIVIIISAIFSQKFIIVYHQQFIK
jgi:hypothetical protein